MTLRVLFLDIDGVLNSSAYLKANPDSFDRSGPNAYLSMFDPVACARLQVVLTVTGAKIVISSSWRHVHTIDEIRGYLAAKGITAEVIDFTPIGYNPDLPGDDSFGTSMTCRGHEIAAWVDAHPELEAYAVVDDNSDMDGVRERFVQTTWERGLKIEHARRLVRVLMRPRQFHTGQLVHVYGRLPWSDPREGDDSYELGRIVDPAVRFPAASEHPTGATVKIINAIVDRPVFAPYEKLSEPFPSWQQLAYGFEKVSPP